MSQSSPLRQTNWSVTAAGAWTAFLTLRWLERLLPTFILRLLLRLPAAAWDSIHLRPQKLRTSWRSFPKSWQPRRWRYVIRQSLGFTHAQTVYIWPDRLSTPRWRKRCHLEGGDELFRNPEDDRPVVLASVHFGPFETLPYWLRAHGVVTTMIRGLGPPEALRGLTHYQHALSPPANVPVCLLARDMTPLPRFSRVDQLIGPGRRLLLMVDVDRGLQFHLPFEDRLFRMATGAIRLAAMANAQLIPCLIAETGGWQFTLHFGAPVPSRHLGQSPDLPAVGRHLLSEFSPVIRRYPEQCRPRLLAAMSQQPPEDSPVAPFVSQGSSNQ